MEEITGLISSVGFPIAAFLLMFWQNREFTKEVSQMVLELKNSVTQNTAVLEQLANQMSRE